MQGLTRLKVFEERSVLLMPAKFAAGHSKKWTWDEIQSEEIHSSKITFLEIEFDYSKIEMPAAEYIDMIQESVSIRYKYYGCKNEYVGTIYTDLRNNTISDKTKFYEMDMNETIKYLESRPYEIVFWSIWILLTIGLVYAFCYFENRWLDDWG